MPLSLNTTINAVTSATQLFGSGLLFSTGLGWFFVQAWIFAIEARTTWLLVLLTITSTVAILSQSYLCAVVISIAPVSPLSVSCKTENVNMNSYDLIAIIVRGIRYTVCTGQPQQ